MYLSKIRGAIACPAPPGPTGLEKIEVTRTAAASDYRAVGTGGQGSPPLKILAIIEASPSPSKALGLLLATPRPPGFIDLPTALQLQSRVIQTQIAMLIGSSCL